MDCMYLQALGDSSDSDYSNSNSNSSHKANFSNENSIDHIEVDQQEAVNEDVSLKVYIFLVFILPQKCFSKEILFLFKERSSL